MFKINRTSGASTRNSDTTTSGGQQPQQDPAITTALTQIQGAIDYSRGLIYKTVEDGRGFVEQAAYLRNNGTENNQKAQEFAEQNQPTQQFVMMADVWYTRIVEIRDRVLGILNNIQSSRQNTYNAVKSQFNTSYEVQTKFEELNEVVTEIETIVSVVNGYMYEAQSYKANVESIDAFNQQRQNAEYEAFQRGIQGLESARCVTQ
jgi:hypothetical protein